MYLYKFYFLSFCCFLLLFIIPGGFCVIFRYSFHEYGTVSKYQKRYFRCHKGLFFIPLHTDLNRVSEDGQYETLKKTQTNKPTYFSLINLELSKWESQKDF